MVREEKSAPVSVRSRSLTIPPRVSEIAREEAEAWPSAIPAANVLVHGTAIGEAHVERITRRVRLLMWGCLHHVICR